MSSRRRLLRAELLVRDGEVQGRFCNGALHAKRGREFDGFDKAR
jgi:hypothetical protein